MSPRSMFLLLSLLPACAHRAPSPAPEQAQQSQPVQQQAQEQESASQRDRELDAELAALYGDALPRSTAEGTAAGAGHEAGGQGYERASVPGETRKDDIRSELAALYGDALPRSTAAETEPAGGEEAAGPPAGGEPSPPSPASEPDAASSTADAGQRSELAALYGSAGTGAGPAQGTAGARRSRLAEILAERQGLESASRALPPSSPLRTRLLERSAALYAPPAVSGWRLSSGLPVLVVDEAKRETVRVTLAFRAGAWTDPPGLEGLSSLAFTLLPRGAGGWSRQRVEEQLAALGARLLVSGGEEGASISLVGPPDALQAGLDLLAQAVLDPAFDEEELEAARRDLLAELRDQARDPTVRAERAFRGLLYGEGPLGRLPSARSVLDIQRQDLLDWWGHNLHPSAALLAASGDFAGRDLRGLLETEFSAWEDAEVPAPPRLPEPRPGTYLLDTPGATPQLWAARPALDPADPAFPALAVAAEVLRQRLLAAFAPFGALAPTAFLDARYSPATWRFHAELDPRAAVRASSLLASTLDGLATTSPPRPDEVERARATLLASFQRRTRSADGLLDARIEAWRRGLPSSWIEDYPRALGAVGPEEATEAARTLSSDGLVLLLAADFHGSGWSPCLPGAWWVDARGRPTGRSSGNCR